MSYSDSATGTAGSPASGNSGSLNPTLPVSEVHVNGDFSAGGVRLEQEHPEDGSWSQIWQCGVLDQRPEGSGKINPVITPDVNINYRLIWEGIVGTINLYFGA